MKSLKNTLNRDRFFSALVTGVFIAVAGVTTASAESWELRTADDEVIGTKDIEAGRIDKGIRVLENRLSSAKYPLKSAVLVNLCLAYTVKRDYETAMDYCNKAVSLRANGVDGYNNRGVIHALQGDFAAAISDFRKAGCLHECPAEPPSQASTPKQVARRNLQRAQTQLAIQEKAGGELQASASVTP